MNERRCSCQWCGAGERAEQSDLRDGYERGKLEAEAECAAMREALVGLVALVDEARSRHWLPGSAMGKAAYWLDDARAALAVDAEFDKSRVEVK